MSRIPEAEIEAAKRSIDFVEYMRQEIPDLKKAGQVFQGRCPFPAHRDQHPSFTIYPDEGRWHCFGCDRKGDIISYVQQRDGVSFRQALATLRPDRLPSAPTKDRPLGEEEAWQRLRERGIVEETARHFKIEADLQRQAWVYPIVINGQEVAKRFKSFHSNAAAKYWIQPKGKGIMVYNYDGVQGQEEIWLSEGEPDVWILHQHDVPAVSFTGGARHVPKDATEQLLQAGVKRINICYDSDAAGREGARHVAAALASKFEVTIRDLPEGLGDKADITDLYQHQKEHFKQALLSLRSEKFEPPKTIFKWEELVSGELEPVDWVVEKLIPARGVVVIGGDAGVGKSWLALHITQCVAAGKPVLGKFTTTQGPVVYIDEEGSQALLARRVQKLAAGLEVPDDIPVTLCVNHQVRIDREDSLEALLSRLEEEKPKLVVFDSLVRIHGQDENDSREMSEVMAKFREVQARLGCAVMFTHHSRKRSQINQAGQMLRGSTDIRAFVDGHLFMRTIRGDQRKLLEHEKSRYCQPLKPFEIEIADNEAGTATLLRYIGPRKVKKTAAETAKDLIIEVLTVEGPMTRQQIIGRLEGQAGSKAVSDALKKLYEAKVLERKVGARRRHTYSLSPSPGDGASRAVGIADVKNC